MRFTRWRRKPLGPRVESRKAPKNPAMKKKVGILKMWMKISSQEKKACVCASW